MGSSADFADKTLHPDVIDSFEAPDFRGAVSESGKGLKKETREHRNDISFASRAKHPKTRIPPDIS